MHPEGSVRPKSIGHSASMCSMSRDLASWIHTPLFTVNYVRVFEVRRGRIKLLVHLIGSLANVMLLSNSSFSRSSMSKIDIWTGPLSHNHNYMEFMLEHTGTQHKLAPVIQWLHKLVTLSCP
jgi:hypothetical protein